MKNTLKAAALLFSLLFCQSAVWAWQTTAKVDFPTTDNYQLWLDTVAPVMREVAMVTDSPVINLIKNDGTQGCWIHTSCAGPPDKIFVSPQSIGALQNDVNSPEGYTLTHELRHLKPSFGGSAFFGEGLAVSGADTVFWLLNHHNPGFVGRSSVLVSDILRSHNPYAVGISALGDEYDIWTLYSGAGGMLELVSGGDFRQFDQELLLCCTRLSSEDPEYDYAQDMRLAADRVFPLFDGWKPSDYFRSSPSAFKSNDVPDGRYLAVGIIVSSGITDGWGNQLRGQSPIVGTTSLPAQFTVREWKDGKMAWRRDGTINWAIRDAKNEIIGSGKKAPSTWITLDPSLADMFGAYEFLACWNDPADPNADCTLGDPSVPNASTFFIAVNRTKLPLLGEQFWKDRTYVIKNADGFHGFSDKKFALETKPGDLPEVEDIPGFDGILAIRNHGSKKPIVVTDGVRHKTYTPSYGSLPGVESATRIPIWIELGDQLLAVSNGSDWSNSPLVPGSIYTLWGKKFTEPGAQYHSQTIPLSTELGGVEVLVHVNGQDYTCPLYFVSEGQVNFQVPTEIPKEATEAYIRMKINGQATNPLYVKIGNAAPSVFYSDWRTKQPAAVFASGPKTGQMVTPQNPPRTGDYVSLYCNGLGPVQPNVKSGAKPSILSITVNPVTVALGGVAQEVIWTGLAPEFVGLYQVNIRIASSTPATLNPLTLSVSGVQNSTPIMMVVSL